MSTENNNEPNDPSDSDLGDAGKKALASERSRADKAERQVRALESQIAGLEAQVSEFETERDTLTSDLASKDKEITRLNVGIDKGLPKSLIARLQGEDEDSLSADADALLEFVPADAKPVPKVDPSQGPKPAGAPSTAQQFADALGDF